MEHARNMLSTSGFEIGFQVEVVITTAYMINKSPTTTLNGDIPKEVWCGKLIDYYHLCIFGCDAFSSLTQSQGNVFLNYDNTVKGYIFWNPIDHKVIIT